jgi:tetratricopeptide (TPR) repeat protein
MAPALRSLFWRFKGAAGLPGSALAEAEVLEAAGRLHKAAVAYSVASSGLASGTWRGGPAPPPAMAVAIVAPQKISIVAPLGGLQVQLGDDTAALSCFETTADGWEGRPFAAAQLNAANLLRRHHAWPQALQLYSDAIDTAEGATTADDDGGGPTTGLWWDAWRHCAVDCGKRAEYLLALALFQMDRYKPVRAYAQCSMVSHEIWWNRGGRAD